MTTRQFEARYRADPDPWRYESSAYEREKYRATLDACGPGPFAHALELGASIGVFSALLAPRCRALVTIDAAPTAVLAARHRLARIGGASVHALIGELPAAIPHATFDLVLASEILYYLTPGAFDGTLRRLRETMARGARLVAVHWRPGGPERPFTAADVHARLRAQPWLAHVGDAHTADYLLDVMERPR